MWVINTIDLELISSGAQASAYVLSQKANPVGSISRDREGQTIW